MCRALCSLALLALAQADSMTTISFTNYSTGWYGPGTGHPPVMVSGAAGTDWSAGATASPDDVTSVVIGFADRNHMNNVWRYSKNYGWTEGASLYNLWSFLCARPGPAPPPPPTPGYLPPPPPPTPPPAPSNLQCSQTQCRAPNNGCPLGFHGVGCQNGGGCPSSCTGGGASGYDGCGCWYSGYDRSNSYYNGTSWNDACTSASYKVKDGMHLAVADKGATLLLFGPRNDWAPWALENPGKSWDLLFSTDSGASWTWTPNPFKTMTPKPMIYPVVLGAFSTDKGILAFAYDQVANQTYDPSTYPYGWTCSYQYSPATPPCHASIYTALCDQSCQQSGFQDWTVKGHGELERIDNGPTSSPDSRFWLGSGGGPVYLPLQGNRVFIAGVTTMWSVSTDGEDWQELRSFQAPFDPVTTRLASSQTNDYVPNYIATGHLLTHSDGKTIMRVNVPYESRDIKVTASPDFGASWYALGQCTNCVPAEYQSSINIDTVLNNIPIGNDFTTTAMYSNLLNGQTLGTMFGGSDGGILLNTFQTTIDVTYDQPTSPARMGVGPVTPPYSISNTPTPAPLLETEPTTIIVTIAPGHFYSNYIAYATLSPAPYCGVDNVTISINGGCKSGYSTTSSLSWPQTAKKTTSTVNSVFPGDRYDCPCDYATASVSIIKKTGCAYQFEYMPQTVRFQMGTSTECSTYNLRQQQKNSDPSSWPWWAWLIIGIGGCSACAGAFARHKSSRRVGRTQEQQTQLEEPLVIDAEREPEPEPVAVVLE